MFSQVAQVCHQRSPAGLLSFIYSDMQTYGVSLTTPFHRSLDRDPGRRHLAGSGGSDARRGQGWLIAFLPTKHTEKVTFENIFKKYFICNALQKHRENKPTVSYHACVGGHYLRWEGKQVAKRKKSKIRIKQTPESRQTTVLSIRELRATPCKGPCPYTVQRHSHNLTPIPKDGGWMKPRSHRD